MNPPPAPVTRRQFVLAAAGGASMLAGGRFVRAPLAQPVRAGPSAPSTETLQAILDELLTKHRIPGAIVALARDGQVTSAAAGIANLNTGVPMTVDTGFLTGSITKVWTASLVMTFVDDGIVDLDRPIQGYLPHFRLADAEAARTITTRQLLNHSSGIDAGDLLLELGEGPSAHRRYVELLADVGQIHRPGAYSSYCNGGFIVAGHLLEHLTGRSYDALLAERIIAPLGLERTFTDTDQAILHRVAIGSVPVPGHPNEHRATPRFHLPKSAGPAGATLITTVADNLAFAAMHVRQGRGPTGRQVLSESSARAMATRSIGRPVGSGGFGLGWGVSGMPPAIRLSHSGGSNGGIAQLVALPESGIAYAAFANSSVSYGFHGELQRRVMATATPEPARPAASSARPTTAAPATPEQAAKWVGTYRRKSQLTTLRKDGSRLVVEVTMVPEEFQGSDAYLEGQQLVFEVIPSGPSALVSVEPVLLGQRATFDFLEPEPGGRYRLLYSAGRLSRRDD